MKPTAQSKNYEQGDLATLQATIRTKGRRAGLLPCEAEAAVTAEEGTQGPRVTDALKSDRGMRLVVRS